MVYNPDFLAHSVFLHDKSLSKKPGLYTIWKYLKKIFFLYNTYLYMYSEWSKTEF